MGIPLENTALRSGDFAGWPSDQAVTPGRAERLKPLLRRFASGVAPPPTRTTVLLIAGLALVVRLAYLAWFVGPNYQPELDAREYSDIAASLATGRGFALADGTPTAIRPPLFPLLLAAVYRLAGVENYGAGLVFQAFIGVGIVLATLAVGQRFGRQVGVLAGLIAATYPLLVFAGGSLLTEPLFILLVVLAMNAGLAALAKPSVKQGVWLGLWLGLAGLARPNGLLLAFFLVGWLLLAARGAWRQRVGMAIGAAAIVALVTSPWIIRNYLVFHSLIPSTTMGGAVLFGAYNERILNEPALRGDWVSPCEVPGAGWTCGLDELRRDAAWRALGMAFIREHLTDLPAMVWWRFIKFWHLYPFRHGFPANVGFWYYAVVALLAVGGVWALRSSWRQLGVLLAVIACFMATALMFWGGFRMRAPAEPALIVLAAAFMVVGFQRVGRNRIRPRGESQPASCHTGRARSRRS